MHCTRCGAENAPTNAWCLRCGNKMEAPQTPAPFTPQTPAPFTPQPSAASVRFTTAPPQSEPQQFFAPVQENPNVGTPPLRAPGLFNRYQNGYRVVGIIEVIAVIVKVLGFVVAGISLISGLVLASQARNEAGIALFFLSMLYGGLLLGILWIHSIFISATAQFIKAVLDIAVNTSPLLRDKDRIEIMSL